MQVIRITHSTCPACAVLKEVMKRIAPQFPDLEIIDLDDELDEEEVSKYKHEGVPFLKMGDLELTGSHTRQEVSDFLLGKFSDIDVKKREEEKKAEEEKNGTVEPAGTEEKE